MLALTRMEGEEILIGDDVVVKVVRIKDGNRVVVGITAPTRIAVHRREVYEQIQQERAQEARLAPTYRRVGGRR